MPWTIEQIANQKSTLRDYSQNILDTTARGVAEEIKTAEAELADLKVMRTLVLHERIRRAEARLEKAVADRKTQKRKDK